MELAQLHWFWTGFLYGCYILGFLVYHLRCHVSQVGVDIRTNLNLSILSSFHNMLDVHKKYDLPQVPLCFRKTHARISF